jgi:hypothetical protein
MKPTPQQITNRATWLAALRSGEYQQGRYVLHRPSVKDDLPDEYCCLGVGAECAGVERLKPVRGSMSAFNFGGSLEQMRPPAPWFVAQYGVSHLRANAIIISLMSDNDDGIPFNTIADNLERAFAKADASD